MNVERDVTKSGVYQNKDADRWEYWQVDENGEKRCLLYVAFKMGQQYLFSAFRELQELYSGRLSRSQSVALH